MELTKAIARNAVRTTYDNLPQEAKESTKRSILDTLGCMFPPTTLENACLSIYEMVIEVGGAKEATIVGFGGKAPSWEAAFVNGSLTHPLDYDDVLHDPSIHPSGSTVPAALAIAEKLGGVTGKDFITAIALGNDLCIRGSAAPRGQLLLDYPWFHTTIFGAFTAALTTGKLLALSEEQMVNALGIALHRTFGLSRAMLAPNSEIRSIRDGFTCKEGIICGLMASRGITACKDSLEQLYKFFYRDNFDPSVLTSDLGSRFRGSEVCFKPWPSCSLTHSLIEATLGIIKQEDIKPHEVSEVVLTLGKFAAERLCEPAEEKLNPRLGIEAKLSMPFTIGVALARRNVVIDDFLPQNLGDPLVMELARKVHYQIDPSFGDLHPTITTIMTNNGRTFTKRIDDIYGSPQKPLTQEDLAIKFKDCARYSKKPLSPRKVDQLIDKISRLEEVADIKEIAGLLG